MWPECNVATLLFIYPDCVYLTKKMSWLGMSLLVFACVSAEALILLNKCIFAADHKYIF